MIIPPELQAEEDFVLDQIRRGGHHNVLESGGGEDVRLQGGRGDWAITCAA
jgi:hypothetical protein